MSDQCKHLPERVTTNVVYSRHGRGMPYCLDCGAYRESDSTGWVVPVREIDCRAPLPQLAGTFPVVLYFDSEQGRNDFIVAVRLEMPNLVAKSL